MESMFEIPSSKRYEPPSINLKNKNNSHTLIVELTGTNNLILEVGTSTGYLTKILQELGNHIIGVEMDEEAADVASKYCDLMITGDVEEVDFDEYIGPASIDVVIFGDVLEHIKYPAAVLKKIKKYLKPQGYIVVSIPNVCHGDVLLNLLKGDFKYTSMGLLDETHLRFFGLKNVFDLLGGSGYSIAEIKTTRIPVGNTELRRDMREVPRELFKFIEALPNSDIYQFVLRAGASKNPTKKQVPEANLNEIFDRSIEDLLKEHDQPLKREIAEICAKHQEALERIRSLNDELQKVAEHAQALDQSVSDREGQISALNEELKGTSAHVQELEEAVSDREGQISALAEDLNGVLAHVPELEAVVSDRDGQISALNEILQEALGHSLELEYEIAEMRRSIIWQITMKYHSIFVEHLLPHGARRRRWYDKGVEVGRILVNDGWRCFNKSASDDVNYNYEDFLCGIDTPISNTIDVGHGTVLHVNGWCFHKNDDIKDLRICFGSEKIHVANYNRNLPRPDVMQKFAEFGVEREYSFSSGFWCVVPIKRVENECVKDLSLEAMLSDGNPIRRNISDISLTQTALDNSEDDKEIIKKRYNILNCDYLRPYVVICLATYNPDRHLFEKQINSIKKQLYKSWMCIINDDCSSMDKYNYVVDVIGGDERFIIFRNTKNLGFYYNFEKLLKMVPDDADFVALSDQDDFWYKEKIQRCILEFDKETTLVYSDMRIVDDKGNCVSPTFWTTRKNYCDELDYLILANTVTGAALMFRQQLIDYILPFPPKIGDSFHDHWIACVANVSGTIRYIDEPLYDYTQHSGNVLGQATFSRRGLIKLILPNLKPDNFKSKLFYLQYVYKIDGARLATIANCLMLRFENVLPNKKEKNKDILKFVNLERSSRSMFFMKLRSLVNRKTTNNAELRLFCSFWANRLICTSYLKQRYLKESVINVANKVLPQSYNYENVKNKIAPLTLSISNKQEVYINILIPSIDFRYFFGGYIAKFNLAKKLVEIGYNVRLILVDQDSLDLEACKGEIKKYPGLEDVFDLVPVVCALDRTTKIDVSSSDVFIATTWWTAHIAHDAVKQLDTERFIYFIQEFEPFTFPMGAYYALAMQSYSFPHYAAFSTELLQEYFRDNKFGVYEKSVPEDGDEISIYFENAIRSFDLNKSFIQDRKPKKLLFYARPEEHAARNMFDMGMIALQEAVNKGILKSGDWEFYGIGSVGTDKFYPITDDVNMAVLPRVGLDEYYEMLPKFDLGLSLMYTPHPSLPPLDMAAAGLIVVTNTCMNKTEDKLKKISKNIIGVSPTVGGVVEGLKRGAFLVKDYDLRIEGSRVNWADDWDKTFSEERINRVKGFVESLRSDR